MHDAAPARTDPMLRWVDDCTQWTTKAGDPGTTQAGPPGTAVQARGFHPIVGAPGRKRVLLLAGEFHQLNSDR